MDWNRIEGNWKQVKGKVKEKWGKLTDDELDKMNGRRDQLEGKIQERYVVSHFQSPQRLALDAHISLCAARASSATTRLAKRERVLLRAAIPPKWSICNAAAARRGSGLRLQSVGR